ncbi:CaiB/BaiF CoA transferase family protein [Variovorax sp. Root473]|uniref:CaiB/BaiF CoA transferase family protein n=1 Tax=Variovorax sp. Root473 TaxID=1736541 RepID=UPI0006F8BDBF|nr:CoA transferase [Variovorax sp. Root473]KQX95828.1 carnitine dehydratase [Variovorax sp. Root473]
MNRPLLESLPSPRARPSGAPLALEGLKVVDFSHFLSGPYCTQILADFGAEVWKIEKPAGGDDFRSHKPPALGGESLGYLWTNRNKQGLCIDLYSQAGRELALKLIDQADVLVENFSTGVMQRLGLDYDSVSRRNPRLIYCSISAAGREGELGQRVGFDPIAQAESGLMALNGHPDAGPVVVGSPIIDITTGMMAGNAVLAALAARARDGQGQLVEVAMMDQAAQMVGYRPMTYVATGNEPPRVGNSSPVVVAIGMFATATGPIYLCCANERSYQRLMRDVLFRPDLCEGVYADPRTRIAHRDALRAALLEELSVRPREEWLPLMSAAGVPAGAARTVAEAMTSEDMRQRGLLTAIDHPVAGTVPNLAPPYRLSRTPVADPKAAPTLGQHTVSVLRDVLGLGSEDIQVLVRQGVLGQAEASP